MKTEFEIIEKYFNKKSKKAIKGIGDDAALFEKDNKNYWAISTDTLNEKIHFLSNTDPFRLGWKAAAVNVSDILSMGASPLFALLSISLPKPNSDWLDKFSKGFFACCKKYNLELIGGDTTKGALSISVTILGNVNKKNALLRSGAQINDDIWVTGELGLAALGLEIAKQKVITPSTLSKKSLNALEKPTPDVTVIEKISLFCNSAIDISDGFISDLNHILVASKVGAKIFFQDLPINKWIRNNKKEDLALYGGDDYQTILTAPKKMRFKIEKLIHKNKLSLSRVGQITNIRKLVIDHYEKEVKLKKGYDHFGKK